MLKNPAGCLLLFVPLLVAAQTEPITIHNEKYAVAIKKARHYVDSLKQQLYVPGMSVAVSVNGEIVWAEGFGYSDREKGIPATIHTKFRIGSISKTLTGLALGKLYQEGKLDFDAYVENYVPYFPKKKFPFTVKQLASHQAGIRHYRLLESLNKKHYGSVQEAVEIFSKSKLKFEPGTSFLYSSHGYVLLSAVIEEISGKDYLEYMRSEIFQPLGVVQTIEDDITRPNPNTSVFYKATKHGSKKVIRVDLSSKWASGGFLSTCTDLVALADGMGKLLSPETLTVLTTPVPLKGGTPNPQGYAIGWRYYQDTNGNRILHHGGTAIGGRAFLAKLLSQNITVAILTNAKVEYNLNEAYQIGRFFFSSN